MRNTSRMTILDDFEQFLHMFLNVDFLEAALFYDAAQHVSPCAQLHYDLVVLLVLEEVQELYNVRVVQLSQSE